MTSRLDRGISVPTDLDRTQSNKEIAARNRYPTMTLSQWHTSDQNTRAVWIREMDIHLQRRIGGMSLPSGVQAQDITQNTWVSFVNSLEGNLEGKPDDYSLTGHVVTIAKRRTVDEMRAQQSGTRKLEVYQTFGDEGERDIFDAPSTQQRDLGDAVTASLFDASIVEKLVNRLGADAVGKLVFLADPSMRFSEKAQALHTTAGAARVRKHRLLKKAHKVLDPDYIPKAEITRVEIIKKPKTRSQKPRDKGIETRRLQREHELSIKKAVIDYVLSDSNVENEGLSAIQVYPDSSGQEETLDSGEFSKRDFETALLFFSQEQRTAAFLVYNQDVMPSEIAQRMGMSKQQVIKKLNEVRGDLGYLIGGAKRLPEVMQLISEYHPSEETLMQFAESVRSVGTTGEAELILLAASGMSCRDIEKRLRLPKDSVLMRLDAARKRVFTKMITEKSVEDNT